MNIKNLQKWLEAEHDTIVTISELERELRITSPQPEPQPLNPIAEAYEMGGKIRHKIWGAKGWIQKFTDTEAFDDKAQIWSINLFKIDFYNNPEKWELYTEPDAETQPDPRPLNPIEEAYDDFKPIRHKDWDEICWIKKHSNSQSIDEYGTIHNNLRIDFDFDEHPEEWELYTEPDAETQPKIEGIERHIEKHAKPRVDGYPVSDQDKPKFDQERFEAMFRAVVARGDKSTWKEALDTAKEGIEVLDIFYAKQKGGNNE